MFKLSFGIVVVLVMFVASDRLASEDALPDAQRQSRSDRDMFYLYVAKRDRAYEIRPKRRDDPLRYQNISDEEIKEIRIAAFGIVPNSFVNIGGVVEGCECEDGPACSHQVWILATRDEVTTGLLLSKMLGHWTVGPVQEWWLEYEKVRGYYLSLSDDERRLLDGMNFCELPLQ